MDFLSIWRMFWGELNTPDSFYDKPYEGGMNQAIHILIGIALVCIICLGYALLTGEMPYKSLTWLTVTAGYAVLIESWRQKWMGEDSLVDTAFVSLGAIIPLVSLSEVSFQPNIKLVPNEIEGLVSICVAIVALAIYVYPRAKRKWEASRDKTNLS